MKLLWAIAFGVCPQRPSHSLFIAGQQMPIEARMAGMFAGFLLGLAYIFFRGRARAWQMPATRTSVILIFFVAVLGIDGVNALFTDLGLPHLYPPNLPMRLGTGLLTGLAMAAFLLPAFNSTVWRTGLNAGPLANLFDVAGAIAVLAIYFAAAFFGSGLVLYPLSLLGVLGVPAVLTFTTTTVIAALAGRSNQASRFKDLAPLLLAGLLSTVVILSLMNAVRYTLFGTGPLEMPAMPWKGS